MTGKQVLGATGRWRRRVGVGIAAATVMSAGAGVANAYTATAVPCAPRAQSPVLAQWGDLNDYFVLPGGSFDNADGWFTSSIAALPTRPSQPIARGATPTPSPTAVPAWVVEGADGGPTIVRADDQPQLRVFASLPMGTGLLSASEAPALPLPSYRPSAALRVPSSSRVTSSTVCIKPDEPMMRFFYRDPGVPGTELIATMYQVVHTDRGNTAPPSVNSRGSVRPIRPGGSTGLLSGVNVARSHEVRISATAGTPQWRLSAPLLTGADRGTALADVFVSFTVRLTDTSTLDRGEWLVDNVLVDPFRSR